MQPPPQRVGGAAFCHFRFVELVFFGAMYLCGYVVLWLCSFVASLNG